MKWSRLVWHWTLAVGVRFVLVLSGGGEWLLWRPEVSTPANTALKTREGLWLLQYGLSPYSGASCHTPPLWLAIAAPWAHHRVLYALPNIMCDILAAAAVLFASCQLYQPPAKPSHKQDVPWLQPEQLSVLYLFNPFTVLTCVAGTTTSAENMAVMLAVAGAVMRRPPLAGFGVAVGAYMGLHPLLLTLPLSMLLWSGPEGVLQQVPEWPLKDQQQDQQQKQPLVEQQQAGSSNSTGHLEKDFLPGANLQQISDEQQQEEIITQVEAQQANMTAGEPAPRQQQQQTVASSKLAAACKQHQPSSCWVFVASLVLCSVALLLLSDTMLQHHPEAQCLHAAAGWLRGLLVAGRSATHIQQQLKDSCWMIKVYRFSLLLEDYTPTIGLWWYFFTELFDAFRPFFTFVFHSFTLMLAVPTALRFRNRPLFVLWVQLYISCMFKPYACVGDLVPWMSLLPLLQQQLQCIKTGLFLINSFLLLIVLGPAMWHQWIVVDAANSNFFYSITLLLGVWYTVFLVQMLRFTVLLDRRLAGKDHILRHDDIVDKGSSTVEDD